MGNGREEIEDRETKDWRNNGSEGDDIEQEERKRGGAKRKTTFRKKSGRSRN